MSSPVKLYNSIRPSRKNVRKIFGFLDPLPLVGRFTQSPLMSFCIMSAFGPSPPLLSADVLYKWSLTATASLKTRFDQNKFGSPDSESSVGAGARGVRQWRFSLWSGSRVSRFRLHSLRRNVRPRLRCRRPPPSKVPAHRPRPREELLLLPR